MRDWIFGRLDAVRVWSDLADAHINYSVDEVRRPEWNIDTHRKTLTTEQPGPPEPEGPWEHACQLVRDYEFSPPEIVRALYDPSTPLLGRDMLLEARFPAIHFYCGVRITGVVDETRENGDRSWGWAYETLDGHLERGKVTYEVVKHHDTGQVEFVATATLREPPPWAPPRHWDGGCSADTSSCASTADVDSDYRPSSSRGCAAWTRCPSPARVEHLVLAPSDAVIHPLDALAVHRVFPG